MPDPELEILMEIQDLRMLKREIRHPDYATSSAPLDPERYAAQLEARVEERERRLTARTQTIYRRVASRHERLVAPVVNGVCRGCMVQVPRALSGRTLSDLRTCESCGRFLDYGE